MLSHRNTIPLPNTAGLNEYGGGRVKHDDWQRIEFVAPELIAVLDKS